MMPITEMLQQGGTASLLFIPTAMIIGALHGLEPGHSKTMMAAFIVAVRGTVSQAVLLGISATLSHTAVVWVLRWGACTSSPASMPRRPSHIFKLLPPP